MNKTTLVDKIMEVEEKRAKKLLASAKQVDELLNCLKDIVENDVLMKGETISLAGLFTISLAHKPATTCRNPQTNQPMTTKAYNYVKIRPSKQLRDYDLTVNVAELKAKLKEQAKKKAKDTVELEAENVEIVDVTETIQE